MADTYICTDNQKEYSNIQLVVITEYSNINPFHLSPTRSVDRPNVYS